MRTWGMVWCLPLDDSAVLEITVVWRQWGRGGQDLLQWLPNTEVEIHLNLDSSMCYPKVLQDSSELLIHPGLQKLAPACTWPCGFCVASLDSDANVDNNYHKTFTMLVIYHMHKNYERSMGCWRSALSERMKPLNWMQKCAVVVLHTTAQFNSLCNTGVSVPLVCWGCRTFLGAEWPEAAAELCISLLRGDVWDPPGWKAAQ